MRRYRYVNHDYSIHDCHLLNIAAAADYFTIRDDPMERGEGVRQRRVQI